MTGVPARPNGCGGCPARWSGPQACHCAGCHLTFRSLNGFDLHRTGGTCQHPPDIGMRFQLRGDLPVWSLPGDEAALARLRERRHAR